MQTLQGIDKAVTRLTRQEREEQCLAAIRQWGRATTYRVARTVGLDQSYTTKILWGMVDSGLLAANLETHRPNVKKWVFEVAK